MHLRNHLSSYYSLAVVTDPYIRSAAEAALIRRLEPAGNDVIPRTPVIETTLPTFQFFNPSDGVDRND